MMNNYHKILIAMQEISSPSIRVGKNGWDSMNTNQCILKILKRFGIAEDISFIVSDEEYEKLSKLLLVEDFLNIFSLNDVMIMLYYTFNLEKYQEITKGIESNLIQSRYEEIVRKLCLLIVETMKKFSLPSGIKKLIPEQTRITDQDHARILWANGLVKMPTLCRYAYMYSEEFTEYLIDYIYASSVNIADDNKRKDYLYNIYVLLDERRYMKHSDYFYNKNAEIVRQISKLSISRTYWIEKHFVRSEDKEGGEE